MLLLLPAAPHAGAGAREPHRADARDVCAQVRGAHCLGVGKGGEGEGRVSFGHLKLLTF